MKGDADGLFGYIAECLAKFAKLKLGQETRKLGTVGFTFSFPVRQESLTSGALIKWTKGFDVEGVEDHDVVAMLQEAIKKRNVRSFLRRFLEAKFRAMNSKLANSSFMTSYTKKLNKGP